MAERLSREQIDQVLEAMSGADLIEHIGDGTKGAKVAGDAFDATAARIGVTNGTRAMTLVGLADFGYLVKQLQEVMSLEGPKPQSPESLPDSANTGE